MGSFTTMTAGVDIFKVSVLREIEIAIYERYQAVGCGGCPSWATATGTTTAGTDVQAVSYWRARQDAITNLVNRTNSYTSWRWALNGSMNPSIWGGPGTPATSAAQIGSLSSFDTYFATYARANNIWDSVRRPGSSQITGEPMATSNHVSWHSGGVINYDLICEALYGELHRALQFLSFPYRAASIGSVTSDSGGTQEGSSFQPTYNGCVSAFNAASASFDWGNDWSFTGQQFARGKAAENSAASNWKFSMYLSGYSLSIGSVYSGLQSRPLVVCRTEKYSSYAYTPWAGVGEGGWMVFGAGSYATHSTLNGISPAKSFMTTTWSTNLPTHFDSGYSLSGSWAYSAPYVLMDYDWTYR